MQAYKFSDKRPSSLVVIPALAGLALLVSGAAHLPVPVADPAAPLQALAADDSRAQLQLGLDYRDGLNGVARDPAQARVWLERAANQAVANDARARTRK